ncbi:hypothetical protein E2C06_29270 [Dankookia rubra]|uniref:Alpha/beta hydrolase n=1 Tax=Dankookia rubra TaxID=1442381 RepID=A0A4R5Q815_9PROT|nr:hypothetical protein [Dankookia rubra]TDH59072.1 hypothetical protein E2C06_29270 [Dankookia rubra]
MRFVPCLALLLGLLLPRPAAAEDPVWREALWLQPPGADAPFPVLLALPLGWQPGDAAVVLLPDPEAPVPLRYRAIQALLAAEALVVELDTLAAGAEIPGVPPYPPLSPAAQPAALRDALLRLRTEIGAGLLVVLGFGQAGPVALEVAAEPGVAAAIALGDQPRYLAGAPPPPAEHWPLRAGLLCAALAGAGATPGDCRAGLLP